MAVPVPAQPTVPARVPTGRPVRSPVVISASTCHHPVPRPPHISAWGSHPAGCSPRNQRLDRPSHVRPEPLAEGFQERHIIRGGSDIRGDTARIKSTRASSSRGPLLLALGRAGARHRGSRHLGLDGRCHPGGTTRPSHVSRRRRGRNQTRGNRYPSLRQSRGRVRRRTPGRRLPRRGRQGRHSGIWR